VGADGSERRDVVFIWQYCIYIIIIPGSCRCNYIIITMRH
jgi:hypothetical protein